MLLCYLNQCIQIHRIIAVVFSSSVKLNSKLKKIKKLQQRTVAHTEDNFVISCHLVTFILFELAQRLLSKNSKQKLVKKKLFD